MKSYILFMVLSGNMHSIELPNYNNCIQAQEQIKKMSNMKNAQFSCLEKESMLKHQYESTKEKVGNWLIEGK